MQFTKLGAVDHQIGLISTFIRERKARAPEFFKPFYMASLSCAVRRAAFRQMTFTGQAADYATRMEVWEAAGFQPPRDVPKRPPIRFQPCTALTDAAEMDRSVKAITSIFDTTRSGDSDDLYVIFHELIENCFRHSAVTDGHFGVTCAQCWPAGNLGQIAIVDSGIGVRESLGENEDLRERLQEVNASEFALEKGISGKFGRRHSGLGLALAAGVSRHHAANLIVVSGAEAVRVAGQRKASHGLDNPWEGTMVIFEWRLNRIIDTGPVYDEWTAGEENNDEEFMF